MNNEPSQWIEQNIGKRYVGASLSEMKWHPTTMKNIFNWTLRPKNMLVVLGPPGTGKTYLCAALITWMWKRLNSVRYHDEKKLLERLRDCIHEGKDYTREIPMLIDDQMIFLNDLGSAGFDREKYPWREEVWFSVIDEIYNKMTPTVITTNLQEDEIKNLVHERLVSRIFDKDNTIIDLTGEHNYRDGAEA